MNQSNSMKLMQKKDILAWLSLIIGCISFLSVFIYAPITFPMSIVGIVLGVISRKGSNPRLALAGIMISVFALVLIILLAIYIFANRIPNQMDVPHVMNGVEPTK